MSDSRTPGQTGSRSAVDNGTMACWLFRVTGRVQGVFFRASTQKAARDLGLGGYARNMRDGSVEVLACGSAGSLDALQSWLQEGPPVARVDGVAAESHPYQRMDGFDIR